jgi:hypothetical protein
VFFLAWMTVVFTVWTTWPGQDHGTRMADSNILNAGGLFDRHGLGHRHGIPQLETYDDAERRPILYGTYPPGPYWVHGALRLAGLDTLPELRGASVIGATVAGLMGLCAFSVLARSWLVGALAAWFYCFSAPFSGYADSVHMNVWMQIGLFGFLLAWAGFERTRGPWRWACLALAALAYFFEIWMTLEHIALIAIVVAVRTVISRRPSVWAGGAVLAAVCLGGMALRVWHLRLEFGTLDASLDYLLSKYQHRSGEGAGGRGGTPLAEVIAPWLRQLRWDDAAPDSRLREFAYPFLQPAVLGLMAGLVAAMLLARVPALRAALSHARAQARDVARSLGRHAQTTRLTRRDLAGAVADSRLTALRAARAGLGWGALLLLASLHWHVGMRQHASIHPHVILNMLPGMALILGSLAAGGLRLASADARGAGWVRFAGAPLAVALMAVFLVHLRDGAVLNRLFPLTPMHAELRTRERADGWWRDLGDAMRDRYGAVRRIVFYHWGPRQANLVGIPHQNVDGGRMPEWFGMPAADLATQAGMPAPPPAPRGHGADLLLFEFPRKQKTPRAILEDGFDRFGMPELAFNRFESRGLATLVFSQSPPPGSPETLECDVRFAGGLRIERLRLSETLTGDAYALCFLVRGPTAAALSPAPAEGSAGSAAATPPGPGGRATLTALVHTFSAAGERTGVFNPRLANRATYRNRSLVWVFIDKRRLEEGGSIRIALTPQTRQTRVPLERGRILPEGLAVDLDADEIVWTVDLPDAPRRGGSEGVSP